jgi:hypothetical protein
VAHLLEMFIAGSFITIGLFMWLSMNGSNSGITLLAGTALLVAGYCVFSSNEIYPQIQRTWQENLAVP